MKAATAASGGAPQSPFTLSRALLDAAGCCREELEFIANTLIFVLSGALITSRIWESATEHAVNDIHPADFAYAILLWVYLLVRPGYRAAAVLAAQAHPPVWLCPWSVLKHNSTVSAQHMMIAHQSRIKRRSELQLGPYQSHTCAGHPRPSLCHILAVSEAHGVWLDSEGCRGAVMVSHEARDRCHLLRRASLLH